jgi:hypothetical protein
MPLKQDPKGGGTEANGTRSVKYCSYCRTDGRFTQPAQARALEKLTAGA